ncbi:MAG: hypothetical protein ACT4PT_05815, partial [Methanobacteriota archaeon]
MRMRPRRSVVAEAVLLVAVLAFVASTTYIPHLNLQQERTGWDALPTVGEAVVGEATGRRDRDHPFPMHVDAHA